MSTDYQAKVVVGVPVTKEDFVETRKITHVLCDHPEADRPGAQFCPVCGTKASKRLRVEEREFPLALLKSQPIFEGVDPEEGEDLGWFEEQMRSDYSRVGGLTFVNLNDHEARTRTWVLGEVPMQSAGRGYGTRSQVVASELAGVVHRVQDRVREIGIKDRDVQAYCLLVCS